jgi:DNA-directed RNA polymerase specialized sigma24 family protein
MYLLGAGSSRTFYHVLEPKLLGKQNKDQWGLFGYYLKHYLMSYFRNLVRKAQKTFPKATISSDVPDYQPTVVSVNQNQEVDNYSSVNIEPESDQIEGHEALQNLFDRFLLSLKSKAAKNKSRGVTLYRILSLRTQQKSVKEIAGILGITISTVYKTLQAGKSRWLKFLDSYRK